MKRKYRIRKDTRALQVNDGDVILIKRGGYLATEQNINDLATSFGRTGRGRCILILVDNFDDLSILTEEEMGKNGWVRKEENGEAA